MNLLLLVVVVNWWLWFVIWIYFDCFFHFDFTSFKRYWMAKGITHQGIFSKIWWVKALHYASKLENLSYLVQVWLNSQTQTNCNLNQNPYKTNRRRTENRNANPYLFEIFVSSLVALIYVNIYIIIAKEECSTVDAILYNEVAIMDYPTTFIMKRYNAK